MKLLSEKDAEIVHLRDELQSLRSQSHTGGLERSLSHISNFSSGANHHDGVEWENGNGEQLPSLHQTPTRKRINLSTKVCTLYIDILVYTMYMTYWIRLLAIY